MRRRYLLKYRIGSHVVAGLLLLTLASPAVCVGFGWGSNERKLDRIAVPSAQVGAVEISVQFFHILDNLLGR